MNMTCLSGTINSASELIRTAMFSRRLNIIGAMTRPSGGEHDWLRPTSSLQARLLTYRGFIGSATLDIGVKAARKSGATPILLLQKKLSTIFFTKTQPTPTAWPIHSLQHT